ncbi:MAG: crossover junction endodeoxyribonuclease RuvC [Bacteroidales bacterium]|nr:crossover junction endodeoxyribonuclease RuvC [Bacteroidales bacterium]
MNTSVSHPPLRGGLGGLERIILGIDPGTNIMGYGLIIEKGSSVELMTMGVLKLARYDNQAMKLKKIFERTLAIIDEYHPDELSVEAPFHGKNVQSMLKLGRAQGVAMAAALYRNIPIFEYSPKKIKMSVTGSGSASKEQVAAMLQTILKHQHPAEYFDATDALAAALCHYLQRRKTQMPSSYSGWKSFLADNPNRIVK